MATYQWTSGVLGLFVAAVIFLLIRRDHLHSRYALWWIPVALGFAVLGLYPQMMDFLAHILGIHYPPVLVLTVGIAFLVIKSLLMDIERSRNERKLHRLAQRIAILEGRLYSTSAESESCQRATEQ